MYDTGYRRTTSVVDIGHRTCDSTRGRNTAEEGYGDVGYTLGDKFGVGVMLVAYHTICHHGGEQTLYSTKHGDGKGRREEPSVSA